MPTPAVPRLPDVGLLGMPYHRFGTLWMTPHHVLTRLARYFHVVWLEPAHHWRDAGSLGPRRRQFDEFAGICPPNFDLYLPEAWLPDTHRPSFARQALMKARVRRGWHRLNRLGCMTRVLSLWHHQFEAALDVGGYDVSVYHIDDDYSFVSEPGPMDPEERRVIQAVDEVFAISPALMERKGGINPHMTLAAEAVEFQLYSTPVPEPSDLAPIPRPRIGYTGVLKEQLDWPMLHALASHHPLWSFVFVGPNNLQGASRTILKVMSQLPNVYLLGQKAVWELAAYPQHFDVCLMPYKINGYTNNIYPLKLNEYLASGSAVVATPIRSLLDCGHFIALATTREEWSAALTTALFGDAARATRQDIARQHDWSDTIDRIAEKICERLGPSFTDRFEAARHKAVATSYVLSSRTAKASDVSSSSIQ